MARLGATRCLPGVPDPPSCLLRERLPLISEQAAAQESQPHEYAHYREGAPMRVTMAVHPDELRRDRGRGEAGFARGSRTRSGWRGGEHRR